MKNNFSEKARQWAPTIIIILAMAFSLVRMHTVQAALCKQIEKKVALDVYNTNQEFIVRELDQIQATLIRIEGYIDNAIPTGKNDTGVSRN